MVKLDLEYIDNWSLSSDIRILLMTVWVVIMKKGRADNSGPFSEFFFSILLPG